MNKHISLLFLFVLGISTALFAQSPYAVHWKKEIPYIATAVGLNLGGIYLVAQVDDLTPLQIMELDANRVNSFDRFATKNFSSSFANASNVLEIGTQLAPFLFISGKKTRKHFVQIMALYAFCPDSKWKPVVWGAAITIPAVMGYFRVAAGKHFPTDVMAGYLVGGAVGFLVPHLHRKKKVEDPKVGLNIGFNSAQLVYRFGTTRSQGFPLINH